jgi:uncharacterized protein YecE (DUF72 family)
MARGQLRHLGTFLPLAVSEPAARAPGRAYVGTSGFSYAPWAPLFYPPGTRGDALLRAYAERLPAVELNNTFYQHPTQGRIETWLAQVPASFRFTVKAQKGGSIRALRSDAAVTVPWLSAPYRWFGERLGSVLYRVPAPLARDDAALAGLLDAWPRTLPLTVELQHPSWLDDAVHAALRDHGAVLCATDVDDGDPPDVRVTGPFLYLRLRRDRYDDAALEQWADRVAPFLADGLDAYVFFKHDADGRAALAAERFGRLLEDRVTRATPTASTE